MNLITLSIQNHVWYATFIGNHAKPIVELFHTDTIPTPFMSNVSGDIVKDRVQNLNPDSIVLIGPMEVTPC